MKVYVVNDIYIFSSDPTKHSFILGNYPLPEIWISTLFDTQLYMWGVCVRDSLHSGSDELLSENMSPIAGGSTHMATIANE